MLATLMDSDLTPPISRRFFLQGALAVATTTALGGCGGDGPASAPPGTGASASGPALQPTPSCVDADDATPAQTEGPYFRPRSPERSNLRDGATRGTELVLSGSVVDTACRPVARALLDFWQADGDGEYDNDGFRLRGHLFTDADGRYRVDTVVPGFYAGRTRHIHVKAQRPDGPVLTTQLYLPGEQRNASDAIFREECLMEVRDGPDGKEATFRFVLRS